MARIVITGANQGIGLELARQFASRGDEVIGTCRSASKELADLPLEVIENIDVTSDQDVERLRERLRKRSVDVLVNNAGLLVRDTLETAAMEDARRQFEVNALGPLRVTRGLLGNLEFGSKVIVVTSRMGSIDDNSSGAYYGYRMSKAAVNIAGKSLAVDLQPSGVAVAMLHPGMVATGMTGHQGIPVAESARGLIDRIDALDLRDTGCFFHANGERLPW